jgi:hypothetical protein
MYKSIENKEHTRQVAVIGLADLERRALRGRRPWDWDVKLRKRRRDAMARQGSSRGGSG